MKNDLRWEPSLFFNGNLKSEEFFKTHFLQKGQKVLFIMGKGFDVRMNTALKKLIEVCPDLEIEIWLIEFNEGTETTSLNYMQFVNENVLELNSLIEGRVSHTKRISLWKGNKGGKRKRVGDRQAANILSDYNQIKGFTDIFIDISALPRGVYFSLIGRFLAFIDNYGHQQDKIPNFSIVVSENAAIDSKIKETGVDEDLAYLYGFGGSLELTSLNDQPIVWFPILGEEKKGHMEKAYSHIMPDEICPILPFPSKNPRRSDDLIEEYHNLLFDVLSVESQNILYVPEQNPFVAYIKLMKAIKNYHSSLNLLGGCKAVISTFSSKLLSISSLLAAYELKEEDESKKIGVGVLNVDSQGYSIDSFGELKELNNNSELFVIWLTGDPYLNN